MNAAKTGGGLLSACPKTLKNAKHFWCPKHEVFEGFSKKF